MRLQIMAALLIAMDVEAIIPLRCKDNLGGECCPIPDNLGDAGKCGTSLGRGSCKEIESDANTEDVPKWPYFSGVCDCKERYGGVDCGECSYGYNDGTPECNNITIRPRQSVGNMTESDWTNYREALRKIKFTPSRYVIPLKDSTQNWIRPTTYNLLTWMHHFVAKDNDITLNKDNFTDFAHEGTGFPTWHRLLLLWFEREIQVEIGDHLFRLPYWDWRDPEQREILFKEDRLGQNVHGNVTGDLFGDFGENWQTVCWEDPSNADKNNPIPICDPTKPSDQRLRRCPIKSLCDKDNENWPSHDDVEKAVSIDNYDYPPYDRFVSGEDNSFRNYMEGFVTKLGADCGDDAMCSKGKNGTKSNDVTVSRKLHNTGHIILGFGDLKVGPHIPFDHVGVMSCVAASPNDPIFINHHAMVDCVLEEWLQRNKKSLSSAYPVSPQIREGHRGDDYIVPLMPLYKHKDMFNTSDNYGYSCPRFSAASFNTYGIFALGLVGISILIGI